MSVLIRCFTILSKCLLNIHWPLCCRYTQVKHLYWLVPGVVVLLYRRLLMPIGCCLTCRNWWRTSSVCPPIDLWFHIVVGLFIGCAGPACHSEWTAAVPSQSGACIISPYGYVVCQHSLYERAVIQCVGPTPALLLADADDVTACCRRT